jgi:hypothetical protein
MLSGTLKLCNPETRILEPGTWNLELGTRNPETLERVTYPEIQDCMLIIELFFTEPYSRISGMIEWNRGIEA